MYQFYFNSTIPRYGWNMTDGFPGIVYNVSSTDKCQNSAEQLCNIESSVDVKLPHCPPNEILRTTKSDSSLANMLGKKMAFSPSFSRYKASADSSANKGKKFMFFFASSRSKELRFRHIYFMRFCAIDVYDQRKWCFVRIRSLCSNIGF